MAFAVVIAALLVALPLQSFGNVFQVLDIVGAMIRLDTSLLARAFAAKEFGDTVRATIVFLLGFAVVAALLTSPFALKRMLFNLYPATKERIGFTAAREHIYSVEGLYALEDRVFGGLGSHGQRGAGGTSWFRSLYSCYCSSSACVWDW